MDGQPHFPPGNKPTNEAAGASAGQAPLQMVSPFPHPRFSQESGDSQESPEPMGMMDRVQGPG